MSSRLDRRARLALQSYRGAANDLAVETLRDVAPRLPRTTRTIRYPFGFRAIVFQRDGSLAAVIPENRDAPVTLVDTSRVHTVATFSTEGSPDSVSFDPTGRYLAAYVSRQWDLESHTSARTSVWALADTSRPLVQEPRATIALDRADGQAYAFSADGRLFASAGEDRVARIWDLPSGRLLATTREAPGLLRGIAVDPAGAWLATGVHERGVFLWSASSGKQLARLGGIDEAASIAVSRTGVLVAVTPTGTVHTCSPARRLFRLRCGPAARLDTKARASSPRIAFEADGWIFAVGCSGGEVWAFHPIEEPAAQLTVEMRVTHDKTIRDLAVGLSSNHYIVVSGSEDGTARVWHLGGYDEIVRIEHEAPVLAVCLTPDGAQILSASADGEIRVTESPVRAKDARDRLKTLAPDELVAYVSERVGGREATPS